MSGKGLHLNESGLQRLAINILERFKKFRKNERYASMAEDDKLAICSKKSNRSYWER